MTIYYFYKKNLFGKFVPVQSYLHNIIPTESWNYFSRFKYDLKITENSKLKLPTF